MSLLHTLERKGGHPSAPYSCDTIFIVRFPGVLFILSEHEENELISLEKSLYKVFFPF